MNFSHWITLALRAMSVPEWIAALTALACVYLTIKNKISNWPWGIVSVIAYAWVFWQTQLYANAGLQVFYFLPCCIYGWWVWAKCGPKQNDDLPVTSLSRTAWLSWLAVTVVLSALIGFLMARYTNDPLPYADGATTAMSIVGQYLQARKVFENWWYWLVADLLYAVYIFPMEKLWVSMGLYIIFLFLAVLGAFAWKPLIGKPVLREEEEPCPAG